MDDRDRVRIVLEHLVERNETDIELFEKWHAFTRDAGMEQVSGGLGEAKDYLLRVRETLNKGLDLMGREPLR